MRSPRGFLGSAALLLAVPVAAVHQVFFASGAEAVVHILLAVGVFLVSASAFEFRLPAWVQWTACLTTGALGALFLLQAVSEVLPNPSLDQFAYQVLGQAVEAWLVSLFLLLCVAVLLLDSKGTTRVMGFVAVSVVFCLDLYSHALAYAGSSLNVAAPGLKSLYLLLPAWLLLESRKREGPREPMLLPAR
jgi:hypothetical protein